MAPGNRTTYIEMDRHGKMRQVRGDYRPRSGLTTTELLNIAEENIRSLAAENDDLLTRLSRAEESEYNTRNRYQVVVAEHSHCRGRSEGLQLKLIDERDRNEILKEKNEELKQEIRLLRRTSHQESYKHRYEDTLREISKRDELLRLEEKRVLDRDKRIVALDRVVAARDNTIYHMKALLRQLGYRYEDN